MKTLKKGIFITFEGGEGCGKSTHVRLLADHLTAKGYSVLTTREPGATDAGGKIREMLLKAKEGLHPYAEILLFGADRIEHVNKVIRPALAEGKVVISDRYIDSTSAYQMGGRGLSKRLVNFVNLISSSGLIPNMTILLDIAPENGLLRIKGRPKWDKFEMEEKGFHEKVRKAYLDIAKNNPGRVKTIASEGTIEEVQGKIIKIVEGLITKYEKF